MARLVVIGEGVAATAFLYALTQNGKVDQFSSIIQLAHPTLAPATSLRSTALAALRGTRLGLSDLGDEQVAMWHHTHELFGRERWAGLTPVTLQSWVYSDKSQRRYGHLPLAAHSLFAAKLVPRSQHEEPAWIIEPATLLSSIPRPKLEKRATLMTSLAMVGEGFELTMLGGEKLTADVVVLATGPWSAWTRELFEGSPLQEMRSVQGSYYQWDGVDYGTKSFALGVEGTVCVYHHAIQRLLLGATSVNDEVSFIPDRLALQRIRQEFSERVACALPAGGEIMTGIRAQTKGRKPWVGELAPRLYAMGGLYKTGWVSAWPLGERLAARL